MPGQAFGMIPVGPASPSNNQRGWIVNVVSGSYAASDLVVDVTAPSVLAGSFGFNSYDRGLYDVSAIFSHGVQGAAGTSYYKRFGFTYSALNNDNTPACGLAVDSFSETAYSALVESDGLHFYRWTLRDGIGARTELSVIKNAIYPRLWLDSQQHLYCCAVQQTDVTTDAYVYRLRGSSDGGRTWAVVGDLPWGTRIGDATAFIDSAGDGLAYTNYHNNVIMSVRQLDRNSIEMEMTRSLDNGVTWESPATVNSFTVVRGLAPVPAGPNWHLYRGILAQAVMASKDLGRSWDAVLFYYADAIDPNSPALLGHSYPAYATGDSIVMLAGGINYGGDIAVWFSRSHDNGRVWRLPTKVVDATGSEVSFVGEGLDHLGQCLSTGTLYLTNGRDRLFVSTNSGQTWEARP